mmetsp:Transcript_16207/g.61432  ORF Transcript_16207/g.61432 Transcript_16207/m.61432 type:complete len:259 (+) Transcript_16207:866-1642(+)
MARPRGRRGAASQGPRHAGASWAACRACQRGSAAQGRPTSLPRGPPRAWPTGASRGQPSEAAGPKSIGAPGRAGSACQWRSGGGRPDPRRRPLLATARTRAWKQAELPSGCGSRRAERSQLPPRSPRWRRPRSASTACHGGPPPRRCRGAACTQCTRWPLAALPWPCWCRCPSRSPSTPLGAALPARCSEGRGPARRRPCWLATGSKSAAESGRGQSGPWLCATPGRRLPLPQRPPTGAAKSLASPCRRRTRTTIAPP